MPDAGEGCTGPVKEGWTALANLDLNLREPPARSLPNDYGGDPPARSLPNDRDGRGVYRPRYGKGGRPYRIWV